MLRYIHEFPLQELTPYSCAISFEYANDLMDFLMKSVTSGDFIYRGHEKQEFRLQPQSFREENITFLTNAACHTDNPFPDAHDTLLDKRSPSGQAILEFLSLSNFYIEATLAGEQLPENSLLKRELLNNDIENFLRLYRERVWPNEEFLELAAIAQHYGIPTRLLDWSLSPFVAASFAASYGESSEESTEIMSIWLADVSKISGKRNHRGRLAIYRPHHHFNARLLKQSGVFMTEIDNLEKMPKKRLDFNDIAVGPWPKTRSEREHAMKTFIRADLPRKEATPLCLHLDKLGFNKGLLLGGLSGIADRLRNHTIGATSRFYTTASQEMAEEFGRSY